MLTSVIRPLTETVRFDIMMKAVYLFHTKSWSTMYCLTFFLFHLLVVGFALSPVFDESPGHSPSTSATQEMSEVMSTNKCPVEKETRNMSGPQTTDTVAQPTGKMAAEDPKVTVVPSLRPDVRIRRAVIKPTRSVVRRPPRAGKCSFFIFCHPRQLRSFFPPWAKFTLSHQKSCSS